jgi:hypothetical protein
MEVKLNCWREGEASLEYQSEDARHGRKEEQHVAPCPT